MQVTHIPPNFSLRLAGPREFALIRTFLAEAGFNEIIICKALELDSMSDLGRVNWEAAQIQTLPTPLRWSIQILLGGMAVPETEARAAFGDEVLGAFQALGLLQHAKKKIDSLVCPVWLYPVDGFLIMSDRRDDPDGEPYVAPEDVVFPAIYAGTLRFLRLLPELCSAEALDLCGGSGIGALHLARCSRSATTADLTERSAFFAKFNASLNGIHVTSLCGDLYNPVEGRRYDVISAHPPFVPATGNNMVYRDGGETGEEVIQRIVEGLPEHLNPDGLAIILCVARDTKEKAFEHRVCEWLGGSRKEFDVIFGLEKVLTVEDVVEAIRKRGQAINDCEAKALFARLQSLGTRQFVYGALFIRRCRTCVVQEPARVRLTASGTAKDFERLFDWRNHCRQPNLMEWLADSRPYLAPSLELNVRHLVSGGQLIPAEFVFSIIDGFQAAMRPDAWLAPLIAQLEGRRSVREIFDSMRAAAELPAGFEFEDFGSLVCAMIERGLLRIDLQRI